MLSFGRPARGILVAVALATTLAAGCGTARHPGGQPSRTAGQARTTAPARTGAGRVPGGGSPAQARAFGRRLLATIALPGGARPAAAHPRVQPAEVPGSVNLVDVSRYAWVPFSLNAAQAYFEHHVPRGMKESGDCRESNGVTFEECVTYSITRPPAGVEGDSQVLVTMAIGTRGGSEVRFDAQLIWYPPRSAAEYINPAGYRAVTVRASVLAPGKHSAAKSATRSVTRTFTSRAAIAKLARVFNGMHVQPPWSGSCPSGAQETFRVQFRATPTGPAIVTVTPDFCAGDLVMVRGKAQPELSDFGSSSALAVINRLLGLAAS
jgi:hypothetical protein